MMPNQPLFHHHTNLRAAREGCAVEKGHEALPPLTMPCPGMAADSGAQESWLTWPQKQDPVRTDPVVHMPGAGIVVDTSSCFPE